MVYKKVARSTLEKSRYKVGNAKLLLNRSQTIRNQTIRAEQQFSKFSLQYDFHAGCLEKFYCHILVLLGGTEPFQYYRPFMEATLPARMNAELNTAYTMTCGATG